MNETALAPVRQSVEVPVPITKAFEIFTTEATQWWPLQVHSISGERAAEVVFEPESPGRVYEIDGDGVQHEWGRILHWDPPKRLLLSWYPGHPVSEATEVEIRFTETSDDSTLVELEHRDWEKLGSTAAMLRDSYGKGWVGVLRLYADRAGLI